MRSMRAMIVSEGTGLMNETRPRVRRSRFGSHIAGLAILAIVLACAVQSVAAVPARDIDKSALIVKLTPISDAAHKVALGASGRAQFDAALASLSVTQIKQIFPPLPPSHHAKPARQQRGG